MSALKNRFEMQIKWHSIFICVIFYVAILPVQAQQIDQRSEGICSPNISQVSGDVILTFSCKQFLLKSYKYQLSDQQTEFLSAHYNVSTKAIINFLNRLGEDEVAPYQLQEKLEKLIVEVTSMREALAQISTRGTSRAIWKKAVNAVNNGDLTLAADLYDQLSDSIKGDLSGVVEQARDYAIMLSLKGRNELLLLRFDDAVESLQDALDALPGKFEKDKANFLVILSEAVHLTPNKSNSQSHLQLEISSQALHFASGYLESDEPLYLKAMTNRLRALFVADKFEEAKNLFNNKIRTFLNNSDVRSVPESLFCFSCMGGAFMNAGEYELAIQVLEEGVKFSENLLIPDTVGLASIYLNLGNSYHDEEKSIVNLNKGLKLLLDRYPEEHHPDIANFYSNIAAKSSEGSQRDSLISKSLNVAIKTVGIDETFVQPALKTGLFEEALYFSDSTIQSTYQLREDNSSQKYDDHVIASIKKHYPEDDFDYLMGHYFYQLAVLHVRYGYNSLAADFYKKAINYYGETKYHIRSAYSHFLLAQILDIDKVGTPEEAKKYYLLSTPIYEEVEGEFGEYTHHTRLATIQFLAIYDDLETADELLEKWKINCSSSSTCENFWQIEQLIEARNN